MDSLLACEAGVRHVSTFAGCDAVGIAVEALGGRTVAYSEFDPTPKKGKNAKPGALEAGPDGQQYNQRLLARRLPDAVALGDMTKIDWASVPEFDFASAGFPCQDLSAAGKGEGLDGKRSGLYVEVIRMIREARPKLVLVENVPRLLSLHFERLLRDLRDSGYDCEWDVISAAAVQAPHLRERLWLLAYPADDSFPAPRAMGAIKKICKLSLDDDGVKWPRSGLLVSGQVFELEPMAPRKTKRVDGRTYWAGVNLLGEGNGLLYPTPTVKDKDNARNATANRRAGSPHNSGTTLSDLAFDGTLGSAPATSPVARDWKGSGMNGQLGTVAASGKLQCLLPSPAATSYGSNQGGAAGRTGQVRHSLESLARMGALEQPLLPTLNATDLNGPNQLDRRPPGDNDLPTRVERMEQGLRPSPRSSEGSNGVEKGLWPTPTSTLGSNGGLVTPDKARDGGTLIEAVSQRMWPTPHGMPRSNCERVQGASGNELRPVPASVDAGSALGAETADLWPTPSVADGHGGPGTSPKRTGGENLRTTVAKRERGSLNPDWVEWMMGLPVGWTDIDCESPVYRPFWDEPMPRVIKECPNRRQRLHAIGNSLVWLIPWFLLRRYSERCGGLPGDHPGVGLSVFR